MSKLRALTGFAILSMYVAVGAFSQEEDGSEYPARDDEAVYSMADEESPPFFLLLSEGAACSWLTRIVKQTERSNFVFEDFLPGVYFRADLSTSKSYTPMVRIAALYPLTSTFNEFPQNPKTPLHYGADLNLGVHVKILEFDYFRLNAGPAIHLFFLNSDRWNYFDLGAALFAGMELPVTQRWTVVFNAFASLDNGNLGGNRNMEPFNVAYQYQIDIGARYSKKLTNRTSLFPGNLPPLETTFISR